MAAPHRRRLVNLLNVGLVAAGVGGWVVVVGGVGVGGGGGGGGGAQPGETGTGSHAACSRRYCGVAEKQRRLRVRRCMVMAGAHCIQYISFHC